MKRIACVALLLFTCCFPRLALSQQPPAAAKAPFQLNQIEQAFLDQLLVNWEQNSAKISTFSCKFQRWEFNPVFGPNMQVAYRKNEGELSFQKPDKGSFQITRVKQFQQPNAQDNPPVGQQQAQWIPRPEIVGEHWVCDGKNIYEYRHEQKQLIQRAIPPEMQGNAIVDGPLPFLFGAKADKLKHRYWMKMDDQAPNNQFWLIAYPKFQSDAANYRHVRLSLDRTSLLPVAMEMYLPDGSRHTYIFEMDTASVNAPLQRFRNMFAIPPVLAGWKKVVEPATPPHQAKQPGGQIR